MTPVTLGLRALRILGVSLKLQEQCVKQKINLEMRFEVWGLAQRVVALLPCWIGEFSCRNVCVRAQCPEIDPSPTQGVPEIGSASA